MTELEQARAHLRQCQGALAEMRSRDGYEKSSWCRIAENNVLAALSWVWDAQGREQIGRFDVAAWRKAAEEKQIIFLDKAQTVGDLIYDYSVKVLDGRL